MEVALVSDVREGNEVRLPGALLERSVVVVSMQSDPLDLLPSSRGWNEEEIRLVLDLLVSVDRTLARLEGKRLSNF